MKTIVCIISIVFLLEACSKPKSNEVNLGKIEASLQGSWKLFSMTSAQPFDWDSNGTVESDFMVNWSPCDKENIVTFSNIPNGTHKLSCNETRNFSWGLEKDGLSISVYYLFTGSATWAGGTAWFISSISDSILVLKWNVTAPTQTLANLTAKYKKL